MNKIILWTALLGLSSTCQALTLDEALARASKQSPELRAARAEAKATHAEIRLASVWENPELEFEAEGIGGDSDAEYTAMVSQEFPLFGKKRKSRAVASYAADAAQFDAEETGLHVEVRVRKAFADLQAEEKIVEVRAQQVTLAEEFSASAQKRYQAGAAPEIEVLRAEMALEESRIEQLVAEKTLEIARKKLARLTGCPTLEKTVGDFFQPLKLSPSLSLNESNPALQRFQMLGKQADAELVREKSEWLPNVTLGAGARYEGDGNIHTYLLSASIPLPLFNRGQACCTAASLRATAAHAQTEVVRRGLEQELDELRAHFISSSMEAVRYRERLLPKAEQAVGLVREGVLSGHYGWLEQVEIQQMFAETQIQGIEAQRAVWMAHAALIKFKSGDES